jgi:hypothetical protein
MNALACIQTICSAGALILAAWSVLILRKYAFDTTKIADASVSQLEQSQTPFVTPVMRLDPPDDGWGLENQGFGPAINGQLSFVQHGPQIHPLPCLAPGARFTGIHSLFHTLVGNQGGVEIQYESLSGRKYRTFVTWGATGSMQVRFDKL